MSILRQNHIILTKINIHRGFNINFLFRLILTIVLKGFFCTPIWTSVDITICAILSLVIFGAAINITYATLDVLKRKNQSKSDEIESQFYYILITTVFTWLDFVVFAIVKDINLISNTFFESSDGFTVTFVALEFSLRSLEYN